MTEFFIYLRISLLKPNLALSSYFGGVMKIFHCTFSAIFLSVAAYYSGLPLTVGLPASLVLSALWLFPIEKIMRLFTLGAASALAGALLAYFLGQATHLESPTLTFVSFVLALIGVSWGFEQLKEKKQIHFIADLAALCDPRTIELAMGGLFDDVLAINLRAIRHDRDALANLKKLEQISHLKLTVLDSASPIEKLCAEYGARWLTSGGSKLEVKPGLSIVDIDLIASRFQPLRREGESLEIKVQRPGKEEGQGVGYLEDGSMVVINGGGEFIGCTIVAEVLSTKQTAAGRIIFCNVKNAPQLTA